MLAGRKCPSSRSKVREKSLPTANAKGALRRMEVQV